MGVIQGASFEKWHHARGARFFLLPHVSAVVLRNGLAAHAREPLTEERRPMMQGWAAWCEKSAPAAVASLATEKAKRMVVA